MIWEQVLHMLNRKELLGIAFSGKRVKVKTIKN